MKKILIALILSVCATSTYATVPVGYVQVSGTNIVDATGTLIANATLHAQPVTNAGVPISFEVNGHGQASSRTVTTLVTSGAFTILLADTALTTPANVCYAITITDNTSNKQLLGAGYSCVQPAGSGAAVSGGAAWCTAATSLAGGTCNFDTYTPNMAALVVTVAGPTGPAGPACSTGSGICTMAVPIALPADPASAMQAATKQYVDAGVASDLPANGATSSGSGTANVVTFPGNINAGKTITALSPRVDCTAATYSGGVSTSNADNGAAFNACLIAASANSGNSKHAYVPAGVYLIKTTVVFPPNTNFTVDAKGAILEAEVSAAQAPSGLGGVILRWNNGTTPSAGYTYPVGVDMSSTTKAALRNISIDMTTGGAHAIGVFVQGTAAASATNFVIANDAIIADRQIVIGDPGILGATSCGSGAEYYQADSASIENNFLWGITSTSIGISVNSADALQESTLHHNRYFGNNVDVDVFCSNGGFDVAYSDSDPGVGSSPAFVKLEWTFAGKPPSIHDNEIEPGGLQYGIWSMACSTPNYAEVIYGNAFGGPNFVGGCNTIIDLGDANNNYYYGAGLVHGNQLVESHHTSGGSNGISWYTPSANSNSAYGVPAYAVATSYVVGSYISYGNYIYQATAPSTSSCAGSTFTAFPAIGLTATDTFCGPHWLNLGIPTVAPVAFSSGTYYLVGDLISDGTTNCLGGTVPCIQQAQTSNNGTACTTAPTWATPSSNPQWATESDCGVVWRNINIGGGGGVTYTSRCNSGSGDLSGPASCANFGTIGGTFTGTLDATGGNITGPLLLGNGTPSAGTALDISLAGSGANQYGLYINGIFGGATANEGIHLAPAITGTVPYFYDLTCQAATGGTAITGAETCFYIGLLTGGSDTSAGSTHGIDDENTGGTAIIKETIDASAAGVKYGNGATQTVAYSATEFQRVTLAGTPNASNANIGAIVVPPNRTYTITSITLTVFGASGIGSCGTYPEIGITDGTNYTYITMDSAAKVVFSNLASMAGNTYETVTLTLAGSGIYAGGTNGKLLEVKTVIGATCANTLTGGNVSIGYGVS